MGDFVKGLSQISSCFSNNASVPAVGLNSQLLHHWLLINETFWSSDGNIMDELYTYQFDDPSFYLMTTQCIGILCNCIYLTYKMPNFMKK